MRFDVSPIGLRRITGVRNIRQALASPYPVFPLTIRGSSFHFRRVRLPPIALRATEAKTTGHSVSNRTMAQLWGGPLAPFSFYKVDDGRGELTVVSQGPRLLSRGERVRIGRFPDLRT